MVTTLEDERRSRNKWGAATLITGAIFVGSVGLEGAVGLFTAGLGFIAEAAVLPEEGTWDAFWGLATIVSFNHWNKHRSLYNHLKAGGSEDTHTHTPLFTHPGFRRAA